MALNNINKPYSLDKMGAAALRRTAWSKEIVYEALLRDPMSNIVGLTDTIDPGKTTEVLPGNVVVEVTPSGEDRMVNNVVLTRSSSLKGNGYYGSDTDSVLGNEEQLRAMYFKAYANDYAHAVSTETYGGNYRDAFRLYNKVKPQLTQWYGEKDGLWRRQAFCQRISENLASAPTSLSQYINANSFLPGSSDFITLEANSGDESAYLTAVLNALSAATSSTRLTLTDIIELPDIAAMNGIKPIKWNGYDLYLLYLSPDEYNNIVNPSNDTGWGKSAVDAAAFGPGDLTKLIPNAGIVVAESVVLIKDRRAPQAWILDSSPTDVTFKYLKPGWNDERTRSSVAGQKVFNANILVGDTALIKFEPEPLHYEDDAQIYQKYKGVGIFGALGYLQPVWRNDNGGSGGVSAGVKQESSAIIYTAKFV